MQAFLKRTILAHIVIMAALSGLIPAIAAADEIDDDPIQAVYQKVLIENSEQSVQRCHGFQQALGQTQDSADLEAPFTSLVQAWKAVETTYMLGSVDVETIDYPVMIDMFNRGKEDITKALDRALTSDNDPNTALYKNSYKTINALEYLLFGQQDLSPRRQALLTTVSDNVCQRLQDIATAYQDNVDQAFADRDKTIAYLLNSLVDSVYKTREWRVGDPAGLSRKHEGEPDVRRQEYYYSQDSLAAIEAILQTHAQMIGEEHEPNFATYAKQQGAAEAMATAQHSLSAAQNALAEVKREGKDFTPENMQSLYQSLDALQTDYYQHLLLSLDVVAKILDADGD